MAYHYNPYEHARAELDAAGFDTTPLTRNNPVFKAGSGRLVHFARSCGRIRDWFAAKPLHLDVTQLEPAQLCSTCCNRIVDAAVRTYVEGARSLKSVEISVAAVLASAAQDPTWKSVLLLERNLAVVESLLADDDTAHLHPRARALGEQLRVDIADVRAAAGSTDAVEWRCAASFLTADDRPEGFDAEVFGPAERWGAGTKVVEAHLDAFQSHSRPDDAHAAVLRRAEQMGDTPTAFSQVPKAAQLDPADFGRLDEYTAAEWRLARDQQARALADHWVSKVRRILDEHRRMPERVVFLEHYTAVADIDRVGPQIGPFAPQRCPKSESTVIVKLPAVVAEWVAAHLPSPPDRRTTTGHVQREATADAVIACDDDTDGVVQVAAGLYDPADPHLAGAGALEAARLVCATNPK